MNIFIFYVKHFYQKKDIRKTFSLNLTYLTRVYIFCYVLFASSLWPSLYRLPRQVAQTNQATFSVSAARSAILNYGISRPR